MSHEAKPKWYQRARVTRIGVFWYSAGSTLSFTWGWRWHWKVRICNYGCGTWTIGWGWWAIGRHAWWDEDWGEAARETFAMIFDWLEEELITGNGKDLGD